MSALLRPQIRSLCCIILIGTFAGCNFDPLHKVTKTIKHPHAEGQSLDVGSANGSISVKQSDRDDVQIIAHVRAISEERANATEILAKQAESGTLAIHIQWPDGRRLNREGCDFEILTPKADGIRLRSSNGKLTSAGLQGQADLETSNGRIEVDGHRGPVRGKTNNGKIIVQQASESVHANTSNGSIEIRLDASSEGPVEAHTSNGSVELQLGSAFAGSLTMSTSNGAVKLDGVDSTQIVSQGKNHAELKLGDSSNQSTITTSNGKVRVRMVE